MSDYAGIRKRLESFDPNSATDSAELHEQRDFARRVALAALNYSESAIRLARAWASRKSVKSGEFGRAVDEEMESRAALAALERECAAPSQEEENDNGK